MSLNETASRPITITPAYTLKLHMLIVNSKDYGYKKAQYIYIR